eukprot:4239886-Pleurochrysis_carterae.AAC.1
MPSEPAGPLRDTVLMCGRACTRAPARSCACVNAPVSFATVFREGVDVCRKEDVVGADEDGDQGGERVVVAEAQLRHGDRVVL